MCHINRLRTFTINDSLDELSPYLLYSIMYVNKLNLQPFLLHFLADFRPQFLRKQTMLRLSRNTDKNYIDLFALLMTFKD